MSSPLNISRGEQPPGNAIDLWYVRTDALLGRETVSRLERDMSEEEIKTSRRFLSPRHAHAYLLAHSMVRLALSHYFEAAPASWVFRAGPYGKPAVVGPQSRNLDFNLSHTAGIAVCAVTMQGIVGVDVETRRRDVRMLDIAKRHFDSREVQSLQELEPAAAVMQAIELWALKESFVKAIGVGLRAPLDSFAICLNRTAAPTLAPGNALNEPPDMWQFAMLRLDGDFVIAIAKRDPYREALGVCLREIRPPNPSFETTWLEPNPSQRWEL